MLKFFVLYKKKYKVGWSLLSHPLGRPVSLSYLHNKDKQFNSIYQIFYVLVFNNCKNKIVNNFDKNNSFFSLQNEKEYVSL
jgi:hypothetical protein